jgi:hypothetical protein
VKRRVKARRAEQMWTACQKRLRTRTGRSSMGGIRRGELHVPRTQGGALESERDGSHLALCCKDARGNRNRFFAVTFCWECVSRGGASDGFAKSSVCA